MIYYLKKSAENIVLDNGQSVIFDSASGNTHVLDETGSRILSLCDGTNTAEDIINHLVEEFNTSAEIIRPDVEDFFSELLEKDVLDTKDF